MDREQLRRIIAEELARVLGEAGRSASNSALPAGRGRSHYALVYFTGERRPCSSLGPLFHTARREGWTLEALPSFTFRAVVLAQDSGAMGDLPGVAEPDHEASVALRLQEARSVIFPDISTNSLNKAALGLADSVPTRAIAHALGSGRGCVFLETGEPASPVAGLPRLETLRRLERRGAVLAGPEDFIERLNAAAAPLIPGIFRSPAGQSVGRSPASRAVVTAEDVSAAARRGVSRLRLPANAIVTERAREEARRLGVELVPDEAAS